MSISADKKHFVKATVSFAAVSAFCFIFGIVYDHFGRGVHSAYMKYAFTIPLVMCVVPYLLMALMKNTPRSRLAFNAYNAGTATLIFASVFRGALRIAGTYNRYEKVTFIAGAALAAVGVAAYLISVFKKN